MRKTIKLIIAGFLFVAVLVLPKSVFAGVGQNVTGWAWSENIGWMSANSTNYTMPGWEQKGIFANWTDISLSQDGQYQTAIKYVSIANQSQIYVSNDWGASWQAKGPLENWKSAAISDNGQYQTAVTQDSGTVGQIYASTNGGDSWSLVAGSPSKPWNAVAMSGDGKYQVAVSSDNKLYLSSDWGVSWVLKYSANASLEAVDISDNGQYLITVGGSGLGGNQLIFVSNNGGSTWSPKGSFNAWWDVAMSADGKYQLAAARNFSWWGTVGDIFKSSDYGATWTTKGDHKDWFGVSMSDDGKYQTAVVNSDKVYVSVDYGAVWGGKIDNLGWQKVSVSGDGKCQTAVSAPGYIYVNCNYGKNTDEWGDYGINIADNGSISGWAWSENIGWISFNEAELGGCPEAPCKAWVNFNCSANKALINGWARACGVFASGCSGALKPAAELGGWDGWIKLKGKIGGSGADYGWYFDLSGATAGKFHGYAFGAADSGDLQKGVAGWISANCQEGGAAGGDICAQSDYKLLYTGAALLPEAKIKCGGNCPGGLCDTDPNSEWIMYQPIGCPACEFSINSTDLSGGCPVCTKWKLVDKVTGSTVWSSSLPDLTFPAGLPAGHYELVLTVSDDASNPDCTAGNSSSDRHDIWVKEEITAQMKCTFDNPFPTALNPTPAPLWQSCHSANFKKEVSKDEIVYLKDDSQFSEGASMINSSNWTVTVDGITTLLTGEIVDFKAGKQNIISLTSIDDNLPGQSGLGRQGCDTASFGSKSLPKWQEISPLGAIWNLALGAISSVLGAKWPVF